MCKEIGHLAKVCPSEQDITSSGEGLAQNSMQCVENQAQLGLVCELTFRVNRHSNGQESPLSHHFVF